MYMYMYNVVLTCSDCNIIACFRWNTVVMVTPSLFFWLPSLPSGLMTLGCSVVQ